MTKAHIISHTHWDREWYRTFQHFRVRLVNFVDKLMNILEKDENFKCFMLDGQTVVLEDYLQIKPQNYERLKKLIEGKRIIIGPWYIQPDEFIPDGESLVRNLLISDRIARNFGDKMKIGYLPDSFGQSSQMPQILKGFDINSAVIMRGIPLNKLKVSEFTWESISGDEVVAVYLHLGYSNSMFLPKDFEKADIRTTKTVEELKRWPTSGNILLMNGSDHEWAEPHIPEYVKHLNEKNDGDEYVQDSLQDYIDSVVNEKPELQRVNGELIIPERNIVHTSIVSVRMYEKQNNRKMETFLEKYVEPVCSIGWLNGAEYPRDLINQAWKYLIHNQAHDSIGGCCTDEVHREIDQRFVDVGNIGKTLLNSYSRAIARCLGRENICLVVFNSAMTLNKQLVKATIYIDDENFRLKDKNGNDIEYQIDKVETINAASLNILSSGIGLKENKKKVEFSFYADFDSNVGFKLYEVVEAIAKENYCDCTCKEKESNTFKNKFYNIKINTNGSIDIFDKTTGRKYEGIHIFEDCGDAGDTYNYSPVKNDVVVTSKDSNASVRIVDTGKIKTTFEIKLSLSVPKKLVNNDEDRSEERIALNITTLVSLYKDIKRIDFKTTVENNAEDHRLRVLFPSSIYSENSFAEVQFGTLTRSNKQDDSKWEKGKWSEKPLPIYSQHKFVDLNDGKFGLSVLNKGLPEYEIYDNTTIALTLFRGIGYMGKRELAIRPGRPSGIEVITPDAQCLGTRTFEYAVVPHINTWDEADIPAMAIEFNALPLAVQNVIKINNLSEDVKLFKVETLTKHIESQIPSIDLLSSDLITINNNKLIVSAVKRAEDEDALIIRLYNGCANVVDSAQMKINIRNISYVILTNFNETIDDKKLDKTEKNVFVIPSIRPNQAITFKVIFN